MTRSYLVKTPVHFADFGFFVKVGDILVHDTANSNRLTVYRNGEVVRAVQQTSLGIAAMVKSEFIREIAQPAHKAAPKASPKAASKPAPEPAKAAPKREDPKPTPKPVSEEPKLEPKPERVKLPETTSPKLKSKSEYPAKPKPEEVEDETA
jgi:hypothetical protein